MLGGDGFHDGEEENSSPGSSKCLGQMDLTNIGQAPGTSGSRSGSGSGEEEEAEGQRGRTSRGESPVGCEQTHEDVDMNSGHDSSSGNDSVGGSRHHHSSANCSPGSTTGSGSTKSSKSATGSSSSSFHSAPHTVCSEQTELGREQTHREMMQTVQEMKKRLPSEKKSRSKASTVEALNYALNCVKQVQATSDYYNLLMSSGLEERRAATVCTLEELEEITSEHTLKNTDTFVVVFSLASGKMVYASEQASSVLHCKRKFLESAKFVELLYHQDVNVFYSHTAQPRLPPWNVCTDSAAVLFECAQVKSFFCRIRGGKDRDGEMRYSPFRITPYLLKVQGLSGEEEPCCLALAERILSGYEAPRIPVDKRIFSTTHSPGCVFLEVDDRAVPLLGYLPQDLIGTSVLTCLHPDDRLLMLAMHRKILKYAGQPPFEHSPIRFRCQNGDYITLDSSWSSFINPWSRKVAFIIGRHKVRTGPLNEDVFAARSKAKHPIMCEDVKELQAMIYKLFLQPVHNNGSSGYGSLGSNGSHEHYISVASSSDSNGNLWDDSHREPMSLQRFCADVNKVKKWGQQAYLDSQRKLTALGPAPAVAAAGVHHNTSQGLGIRGHLKQSLQDARKQPHIPSYQQINCVDSIIRYLESCATSALKRKSESLSIATSSSSSMSEEDKPAAAAHDDTVNTDEAALEAAGALDGQVSAGSATTAAVVGAPLTDITISTEAMSVVSVTSQCSYSSTIVHVPQPESEVTALEDAPMGSEPTDSAPTPARPAPSSSSEAQEELLLVGLTKEVLSAHTQKEEQQFVDRFQHRILQSPYSSYLQQDNSSRAHSHHRADVVRPPNKHKRPKPEDSSDSYGSQPGNYWSLPGPTGAPHSSWPSSESSHPPPSNIGFVPPMAVPMQTAPYFTVVGADQQPMVVQPDQVVQNLYPMTPTMIVLLPSYPMYPGNNGMYLHGMPVPAPGVVPQPPFNLGGFVPPGGHVPHVSPSQGHPPGPTITGVGMAQDASAEVDSIPAPWFGEDLDAAQPTALFSSSRSSSPIQLNLLQEELTKPTEAQHSTGPESLHEHHAKAEDAPSDSCQQDAHSTSSELLDQLLQEDARSGTGSNVSGSGSGESGGSLGSGSNGTSTSHTGSSNSSKYFASNDSSDTSRKARKSAEAQELECTTFTKHVDNPLWSMIKQTPEPVMMTYQIGPRDQAQVLQEDREKLLLMQPMQPWFTQDQKKELAEVHPWNHQHTLPHEINTQCCVSCTTMQAGKDSPSPPTPDSSCPQDCPSQDTRPDTDT
ncbi:period circadian protein homolog 3-like isoform X1 [Carassius auratus]|uniref:Period circadian protein homolog 3-like isoform X1 n=2 Tax=Carassius auratus TaxID=7957 RepID=A0A6P6QBH8_CARAU|nr:period circadian protein homolog 3-like isoform X1 [Carassius auratus]XP_026130909.1 period circadian protein homolog 3-like isoform X1 [Carassius auratus]